MNKPKNNYKGDVNKSASYDQCQTPSSAVTAFMNQIGKDSLIGKSVWEPMCGEGNIVKTLEEWYGARVHGTDLLMGDEYNCFTYVPPMKIDCIISNLPFSSKYPMLDYFYSLGIPFAFIVPGDTIWADAGIQNFKKFYSDTTFIGMYPRVNYKMPSHKTWEETIKPTLIFDDFGNPIWAIDRKTGFTKIDKNGNKVQKKTSGAQMPTIWVTYKMKIDKVLTWSRVEKILAPWERSK